MAKTSNMIFRESISWATQISGVGLTPFARAVAEHPNNARVRYYYGRFLLADQEERLAIEQFSQAVALAPDNGDYHF